MHDKIVTGRQIVYPQGDAFPLCFLCTFHLTPHESPCTSSVTAQLSETSKSHSTASLVLLRSFKRGARAATSTSNRVLRGPRWNRWNRNPSNILIAIHRLGQNVLLDNRRIAQRTNSAVETLISDAPQPRPLDAIALTRRDLDAKNRIWMLGLISQDGNGILLE